MPVVATHCRGLPIITIIIVFRAAGIAFDARRVAAPRRAVGAAVQDRRALWPHAGTGSRQGFRRRPRMGVLSRELGVKSRVTEGLPVHAGL